MFWGHVFSFPIMLGSETLSLSHTHTHTHTHTHMHGCLHIVHMHFLWEERTAGVWRGFDLHALRCVSALGLLGAFVRLSPPLIKTSSVFADKDGAPEAAAEGSDLCFVDQWQQRELYHDRLKLRGINTSASFVGHSGNGFTDVTECVWRAQVLSSQHKNLIIYIIAYIQIIYIMYI